MLVILNLEDGIALLSHVKEGEVYYEILEMIISKISNVKLCT